MKSLIKPRAVVSKCIEFEHCRWNGAIIQNPFVRILKSHIDFIPVCPESEIGLGIPRDPVRIVKKGDDLQLIQSNTEKVLANEMSEFSLKFLSSLDDIDGFILKSKSPSCGLFQTKYYHSMQKGAAVLDRGPGCFGKAVFQEFPELAIETEGRLNNFRIREHWLTKLYIIALFHKIKKNDSMHELVNFHTQNKFIFMAYNQIGMRDMGKIVANPEKAIFQEVINKYEIKLFEILKNPPNYTANINVLMHALGYFSKNLKSEEKAFFLEELEKYRSGWIPLFSINKLIKSWIVRFNKDYLMEQRFFHPYPEELMTFDLIETWRGREY
ncbi:MAG: YbgA family protein [Candidatus Hodarchaeota archaeon]